MDTNKNLSPAMLGLGVILGVVIGITMAGIWPDVLRGAERAFSAFRLLSLLIAK